MRKKVKNRHLWLAKTGDMTVTGSLTVDDIMIDGDTIRTLTSGSSLTLIPDSNGQVEIYSPPSTEVDGISINGTTYDAALRVNDIGVNLPAQFIIHKHSSSLQPILIGARNNDDTAIHTAVVNNSGLLTIMGVGWTGSHYDRFAEIDLRADTTGTISTTSAPGRIVMKVSADGADTPTAAVTITNDKKITFAGIVATNGQVSFPATQNASADANTLDDYEEGTFTPVVSDAASGGNNATAGTSQGTYTKIGQIVFFNISLVNIDTTGLTGANDIFITGMPFTASSAQTLFTGKTILDNVTSTETHAGWELAAGTTYLKIDEEVNSGARSFLTVSSLTSGSADLYFSGHFIV